MGPAVRQEILTTLALKSSKWRKKHNLAADASASFEECANAAIDYHLEPAFEDYATKIVSSNNASRKALDKIIDDIPEDPTTKRLDEAELIYIEQIAEVDNALEEIREIDKNIESFSNSTIAITDAAQAANGLTELTDQQSSRIKAISTLGPARRFRSTQESKLFKLFDKRLGGIKTSGKDETALGPNDDMEKNTPKENQDALPSWIKPQCGKYYTCVPAILRLLKSYDPGTGILACTGAHTAPTRTWPHMQRPCFSNKLNPCTPNSGKRSVRATWKL